MEILDPTALHHTCFLARNLKETAQRLSDTLGIGPWNIWTIEPNDCTVHGRKTPFSFRAALATVGGGTFELISPKTGRSVYAEHLEEHGEGFHHTCVSYSSLEAVRNAKAKLTQQNREVIQEGSLSDILEFAYFRIPEIGSLVEVMYLDAARLPSPEAII